ncbi:hypothetical protein K440DRAFT_625320 [Wilcoxina mikolae CBS 423.85]|nr:hypothetical protein K440DRAFT_625320 [Wilcoxina mikolae CBS 423.85]
MYMNRESRNNSHSADPHSACVKPHNTPPKPDSPKLLPGTTNTPPPHKQTANALILPPVSES